MWAIPDVKADNMLLEKHKAKDMKSGCKLIPIQCSRSCTIYIFIKKKPWWNNFSYIPKFYRISVSLNFHSNAINLIHWDEI